jgi:hypothetical protein
LYFYKAGAAGIFLLSKEVKNIGNKKFRADFEHQAGINKKSAAIAALPGFDS